MNVLEALKARRFAEFVLRNQLGTTPRELAETPTIAVSADFGRYVAAMAERWPSEVEAVAWPTIEEARWLFPDVAALFIWAEPISLGFLITSAGADFHQVDPFEDTRDVVSALVVPPALVKQPEALPVDGIPVPAAEFGYMRFGRVFYVHPDTSITDDSWPWGGDIGHLRDDSHAFPMSQAIRFGRALVEAVGHRLASGSEPSGLPRHVRRAIERTQAPYRVLDLATPNRPASSTPHQEVNWSKRWMVRGHWRNQPYGSGRELRRIQWVDPFVKGDPDKPLDIRPDVFKLGGSAIPSPEP